MSDAYDAGYQLGQTMVRQRAAGEYSYDCRYDLAEAARISHDYFEQYKKGLETALGEG